MLKEFIEKYLRRKKEVKQEVIQPVEEKKEFDISISRSNNIFMVEVSDYISIIDYVERMKDIDHFNLLDLICNAVIWNGKRQQVNKGTYYVTINDGYLYNVFIGEDEIAIDERVKVDDHTEQRHISLHSDDYNYSSFRHDKVGSTYYTMYYSKKGFPIKNFELSEEDAYEEINGVLSNIELIPGICDIVDVKQFRTKVLEDLVPSNPGFKM